MGKDNSFPEKWLKKLPTGFVENVESMSEEDVKRVIFESEGNIYTVDREMDQDQKLSAAKELVKDYSSAYRDAKAALTAKIKYCLFVLEGRGMDLETTEKD
jgi:tricorn protease-like protein